jgi:transposase
LRPGSRIGAHVNALNTIGGVPKAVVCDNLKAGVTAACRYEPGINRTYQEFAEHDDTAILPTGPRKPRDKAKVEVSVQIVQRFVLARLRNRRFFSLYELNAAIREARGKDWIVTHPIGTTQGRPRHDLWTKLRQFGTL